MGEGRLVSPGIVAVLGVLLVGAFPASSRATDPPETIDPDASCVSSECHVGVGKHEYPHWSDFTEPGECQGCHETEDDLHEFSVEDVPGLCFGCHDDIEDAIKAGATVHDPAEDCTDCHDPHGGRVEAMLLGVRDDDNLKPLCFECHDEDLIEAGYAHGPAEQGECNLCHDPHASSAPSLLLAEGIELCGDCHEEIAEAVQESEFVHDPVEDGCTECHNPHSSPYPKMLPAEKHQVCNECHDDIVDEAKDALVDHAPVLHDDECVSCHSPHASNNESNLKMPQRELCLGCHDKPVESGDSTLSDMQSLLLRNEHWHEPIKKDNCTGCHQPHGGANFRLLKEPFPSTFYVGFNQDVYALCFDCHESAAITAQWTRTLTNFRNGNRNLHYLHVDKEKRGRTCRACHDMHASPNPFQIRDTVRFGKWMMPINFNKQESGGSCHPGCHKIRAYDRKAPDQSNSE